VLCDDIPIYPKHVVVEKSRSTKSTGLRGEQVQSLCAARGNQDLAASFLKQHLATFKSVPFVIDTELEVFAAWHSSDFSPDKHMKNLPWRRFPEQRLHVPSTICTKLAKHSTGGP